MQVGTFWFPEKSILETAKKQRFLKVVLKDFFGTILEILCTTVNLQKNDSSANLLLKIIHNVHISYSVDINR